MIIIIITIFVITIFITVLQNYFNINVNFLSGTSKNCKIVNYFRQKNSTGIDYSVLCIFSIYIG